MKLGFELLRQTNSDGHGWQARSNHENPYGVEELHNAVADTANEGNIDKILSIPSPYARFHVTETAFLEGKARKFNELAPVYKRAISHCLDVFEMFYLFDGVDLTDLGIQVEKHSYFTSQDERGIITNVRQKEYLRALELYRHNYNVDFKNFYTVTRTVGGVKHLIATTSPFSVFTTPEDIAKECEIAVNKPNRTLFANMEREDNGTVQWFGIESRPLQSQAFIYALLKKYNENFRVIFNYLERCVNPDIKNQVDSVTNYFDQNFSKWLITGEAGVPIKVDAKELKAVEILPLGYDTFVFENFLNTTNAHDYSIVEKSDSPEYNTEITQRKNIFCNSKNPESLQWITIHDLLEDDVFITTKHVDDNLYLSVPDNDKEVDAILPFKKKFFELFNLYDDYGKLKETSEIQKWVEIRYEKLDVNDGTVFSETKQERKIYVTLHLPVVKSNKRVSLTKIYDTKNIHKLDIDFGIYPFQQVNEGTNGTAPDNFYRIMLYLTGSRLTNLDEDIKLYAKNSQTHLLVPENIAVNAPNQYHVQKHSTITEANYQGVIKDNLYYLSLESKYFLDSSMSEQRDMRFNFVEVTIDGHEALIVPRFTQYTASNQNAGSIAIDLGTSNTYVAYGDDQTAHRFEDDNYNALVGKLCYDEQGNPDFTQDGLHQFTEFIPTKFGNKEDEGSFPVQTLQLYQRSIVNDDELNYSNVSSNGAPFVSMFSMNIPFLYDRKGRRTIGSSEVDTKISNFKWFSNENNKLMQKNAFILFADQLCFMMRNKLIARNYAFDKIKLIWTYPLVIAGSPMIDLFSKIWSNVYKKYFNTDTIHRVLCFTESETPIEKASFAGDQYGIKIGVDIGGGTTDMILYQPLIDKNTGKSINKPTLATSFSFAGNTMFGKISGESAAMSNHENIWFKALENYVASENAGISGIGVKAKVVDIDPNKHNITEFMDYVFTHIMNKHEEEIRLAMANPFLKFISLMHISAIIWEIAKVCKAQLNGKMPANLVFSGNGSKLILMTEKPGEQKKGLINQLVNGIFKQIYGQIPQTINVELLAEPKRATAEGALSIVAKRVDHTDVSSINKVLFGGKLYALKNDALSQGAGGGMDIPEKPKITPQNQNSGFGDIFDSPAPQTAPAIEQYEEAAIEDNGMCPLTEVLESGWEDIADECGQFLDFYFRLATTELGGRINANGSAQIRNAIFGSTSSYKTANMKELIDRAKQTIEMRAQIMSNGINPDYRIKESVFLAVMSHVIAEIIKFAGNRAR